MAELLIPRPVPCLNAGEDIDVGFIWDDTANQITGLYGHNNSADIIYLNFRMTPNGRVESLTFGPHTSVRQRLDLPANRRTSMRRATGSDALWYRNEGWVFGFESWRIEREFAVPHGGSPSVASATSQGFGTSATTHDVTMPATINAGDGLLIGFMSSNNSNLWATGFTCLESIAATQKLWACGKVAVGGEDGTNINFITSSASTAAAHIYRITNTTWAQAISGFEATTSSGTSITPDPPSITPSWPIQDITIIPFTQKDAGTVTTAPTNYTDVLIHASTTGSARRSLVAVSDDPGTFGGTTSADWRCITVAIAPEDADLTNGGKPFYVGCGTSVSGLGAITATLPAGLLENDLLILVIEEEGEDTNPATLPTGWTDPGDNSVASGTGGAAADCRITWGYDFYASASAPDLAVADAGDHTHAVIYAFRNVDLDDPFDAIQSSSNGTAGTSMSITGATSTHPSTLVFQISVVGDDSGAASPTVVAGTNASLAAPAIRQAGGGGTTSGSDGSMMGFFGGLATAGASGAATGTFSASVEQANYTIILASGAKFIHANLSSKNRGSVLGRSALYRERYARDPLLSNRKVGV